MRAYVITEGQADAELLQWALGTKVNGTDVSVVAASGKSSAQSHARTLLYTQKVPVALVIDADANDSARIAEDQGYFEDSLQRVAGDIPFCVVLCIPEIETLAFADLHLLEQVAGRRLTDHERIEAEFAPRRVLQQIFATSDLALGEFVRRCKQRDPLPLRKHPVVARLVEFLSSIRVQAA
jgi:hypothetical protein